MADTLHWLGVTRIDRFVSMSNLKYDALVRQGIEIVERVAIPEALIPEDARVEMEAKKAAGYFTEEPTPDAAVLAETKGRGLPDY
jgi:GTP cyclohydrolase II